MTLLMLAPVLWSESNIPSLGKGPILTNAWLICLVSYLEDGVFSSATALAG